MNARSLCRVVVGVLFFSGLAMGQGKKPQERQIFDLKFDLDPVLSTPALWDMTPEKMEELCKMEGFKKPPQFKWLTESHDGARFARKPYSNVNVDLTMFGGQVSVEEVVINFKNGKASDVNISLFNRGDSGEISKGEFDTRYKTAGRLLGENLKVVPRQRDPSMQTAVKTTGWLWTAPSALALLEFNSNAQEARGKPEFLRLKLAPTTAKDQLLGIAAIGRDATTLKPEELLQYVKKQGDDVYVSGIPMVDQGAKGYCVVASCQRMFSYLHVQCDEHEIAEIAGSDAQRGTNSLAFAAALSKIGTRFKVHFKPLLQKRPGSLDTTMKPDRFARLVKERVDKGQPLLWSLELGLYPEEPQVVLQKGGGHMRMIIGYNTARNQVLFSDSWGAGHELKRMDTTDALKATSGIYEVEPQARL